MKVTTKTEKSALPLNIFKKPTKMKKKLLCELKLHLIILILIDLSFKCFKKLIDWKDFKEFI